MRIPWQTRHHSQSQTFELTFPRDMPYDGVLALLRALSGTLRAGAPPPTVAIEVYADRRGFTFYLSAPNHLTGTVQQLVTTHLAGSVVTPVSLVDDRITSTTWDRVIEIGASSRREPLRIPSPPAAVASLLSAFIGFEGEGAALAQQWVMTAARPSRPARKDEPPTWPRRAIEASADKKKHDEPLFLVVGRLAAKGEIPEALLARLRGPYASLATPGVHFRRRLVSPRAAQVRLHERTTARTFPTVLNAAELAVVSCLPFGRPNVPGLAPVRSRRLMADHTIPSTGLVVATANYPGAERPIALRPHDLLKHTHIHGKTGVGKSALLVNLAVSQMEAGFGVGLIDPTGDTAADLLERIPPHRLGDVVVFEPTDTDYPVGLNVMDGTGNPEVLADQLMAIFHGIYRDNGIYTSNYLRAAIQTLASVPGLTLVEVVPFLTDPSFRARITRQVSDPMLTNLWQRFDQDRPADQLRQVQPAIHRVQPLLLRRSVRLTLGQADNRLDMARVLRERKILVVSLPKGPLGEETSALFGSLVFARLWQAAMSRPRSERYPFFLHVDEAQNFLHMPLPISDVLAEARKYGLGLTLAHQHGGQMPIQLRSAIAANTRTKIAFAVSAEDAHGAARELGPPVEPADLIALGKFEIVIQATTDEQTSAPATARTLPPPPVTSSPEDVRAASRAKWATHRDVVEAAILARQQGPKPGGGESARGWEA